MDFLDLIKNRHSIRQFTEKDIDDATIDKILHLTLAAPSAGNLQAYKIVVVKKEKGKNKLSESAPDRNRGVLRTAAVNFVFFAEPSLSASKYEERGMELYAIQDATIAAAYLQLALYNYGISGVWIGTFDEKTVYDLLKAKGDLRPVAIIAAGYPDEEPFATSRRPFDEIVYQKNL